MQYTAKRTALSKEGALILTEVPGSGTNHEPGMPSQRYEREEEQEARGAVTLPTG